MFRRPAFFGLVGLLVTFALVSSADGAFVYTFKGVSKNKVADTATGEAQFKVEVLSVSPTQVGFKFTNRGPNPSVITEVYFDDGSLLGISSIVNGPGVNYQSAGVAPPNLPGGTAINFNTTSGFLAGPTPSPAMNGVNNTVAPTTEEFVQINFNLKSGKTFTDTINAINLSLANPGVDVAGGLRIGVRGQGFTGGGSESFVNGPSGNQPPPAAVPAPPTLVLAAGGLVVGAVAGRLRSRRRA